MPWFSLVTAFVFGLVFTLPFPSWHSLVSLVTAASVLMYAGAPLSLGAFRDRCPARTGRSGCQLASVISPLAFVVANLIIYWSGFEALWKLGIAIVLGYIVIGMYTSDFDPQHGQDQLEEVGLARRSTSSAWASSPG